MAHVAIDRWGGRNAPDEAGDWLEANIAPFVNRALAHSPRKELTTPGRGATSAGADVLKGDLEDVLRLWIPREVAWQENTAP
ncbi:hypothetical protein SCMU_27870 [Sinomonas cyclohexanicum]|uniref:Uncharacterized protein n=1 Tax=Sinomonas cyclohexanicum TaxID=322009 RepID=A0ABM7PXB4_SINCY|nr:hypothetical protein SCMU_27870 [Corynebacterium cyclohexanicum]